MLCRTLRDAGGDLRGSVHDKIPQDAGDGDVLGAERHSHAFLRVVVVVDSIVAPVGAVVVPDVVVRVWIFIRFHAPPLQQRGWDIGCPMSDEDEMSAEVIRAVQARLRGTPSVTAKSRHRCRLMCLRAAFAPTSRASATRCLRQGKWMKSSRA